jgi:aminopeptidase 2
VPLFVATRDDAGNIVLDCGALLTEKEADLEIDLSRQYLINGGKRGYCTPFLCLTLHRHPFVTAHLHFFPDRVLYPKDRFRKIAKGASYSDSLFTLEDRIGLLSDALAFSVAGLQQGSAPLGLCERLKREPTCNLPLLGIA